MINQSSHLPSWINEPWVSPALRAWVEISMAATPGTVGLDEPGTIDKRLDTNTLTRNTQTVHREVICIGDQETVEAFARVLTADPGEDLTFEVTGREDSHR